MPSPFPGMDPYIESWIWRDFHNTMIVTFRSDLNAKLPRRYIANTDLYVWRDDASEEERVVLGGPDVYAAEQNPQTNGESAVATITAPITTVLPGIERKQSYVRIIDSEGRRVVTVIELLSPWNKTAHNGGEAYRYKREEYISSGVNLVEIDLLRSGVRPSLGNPAPPLTDYYVLVSRGVERPRMGIWPFGVRDPLPKVPVPLDPGEPEVILDLRAALDSAYHQGRYGEQLNYAKPPIPPLREPDATWARELLAARSIT